jgi:predicted ribosomally synthesized peptide with SipW-like signal peptide
MNGKKKLGLGILSLVLVLSLAIGGTFMLFTDKSETATNVVTVGDGMHIDLYENGIKVEGAFTGLDIDAVVGVASEKAVTVEHTGGPDAYLRVKASFDITDTSGAPITTGFGSILTVSGSTMYNILNADQKAYFNFIVAADPEANVSGEWVFVPDTSVGYTSAKTPVSGYFYYVDTAGKLAPFTSGTTTTAIFPNGIKFNGVKSIKALGDPGVVAGNAINGTSLAINQTRIAQAVLPDGSVDSDDFPSLSAYNFKIVLQAQAVQIDGNTPTDTTNLANFFAYDSLS